MSTSRRPVPVLAVLAVILVGACGPQAEVADGPEPGVGMAPISALLSVHVDLSLAPREENRLRRDQVEWAAQRLERLAPLDRAGIELSPAPPPWLGDEGGVILLHPVDRPRAVVWLRVDDNDAAKEYMQEVDGDVAHALLDDVGVLVLALRGEEVEQVSAVDADDRLASNDRARDALAVLPDEAAVRGWMSPELARNLLVEGAGATGVPGGERLLRNEAVQALTGVAMAVALEADAVRLHATAAYDAGTLGEYDLGVDEPLRLLPLLPSQMSCAVASSNVGRRVEEVLGRAGQGAGSDRADEQEGADEQAGADGQEWDAIGGAGVDAAIEALRGRYAVGELREGGPVLLVEAGDEGQARTLSMLVRFGASSFEEQAGEVAAERQGRLVGLARSDDVAQAVVGEGERLRERFQAAWAAADAPRTAGAAAWCEQGYVAERLAGVVAGDVPPLGSGPAVGWTTRVGSAHQAEVVLLDDRP